MKSKEPFILYLKFIKNQIISHCNKVEEADIEVFNRDLSLSKIFKFWDSANDPEKNLFYWCVFSKRLEIAKLFWKMGKVSVIYYL